MAIKTNHTLRGDIEIKDVYIRAKAEGMNPVYEPSPNPKATDDDDEIPKTIMVKKFRQNFQLEVFKDKETTECADSLTGSFIIDPSKPTMEQIYGHIKKTLYPQAIDC